VLRRTGWNNTCKPWNITTIYSVLFKRIYILDQWIYPRSRQDFSQVLPQYQFTSSRFWIVSFLLLAVNAKGPKTYCFFYARIIFFSRIRTKQETFSFLIEPDSSCHLLTICGALRTPLSVDSLRTDKNL